LPDGQAFIAHIESQNGNEAAMPARMLRYLSGILLDFPGLPVRQYLVYIGREPLAMADGFDMPDFSYRYRVIDLHAVDCEAFLGEDSPDAWVLAILCDFRGRSPREVVHMVDPALGCLRQPCMFCFGCFGSSYALAQSEFHLARMKLDLAQSKCRSGMYSHARHSGWAGRCRA
jgi:hypothetical protein